MNPTPLLLGGQAAGMAGLFWPGRSRWRLPAAARAGAAVAVLAGSGLAAWGARGLGRWLRAAPDVPPGAPLRTDGAYALVRHPIYAGLLLAGAGVAVLRERPEPLVAYAGLAAVLHLKAGYEERQLTAVFGPAYAAYARDVPRLLPRMPARLRPDVAHHTAT